MDVDGGDVGAEAGSGLLDDDGVPYQPELCTAIDAVLAD
jgi:hypothetical protein